jgi:hypothetical protein
MTEKLRDALEQITQEAKDELEALAVMKEGVSSLLSFNIVGTLRRADSGTIRLYFDAESCPFYTNDTDGPGAFWIGWEKSDEERRRETQQKGGSAPLVPLGFGNFSVRELTLGSLDNYDEETKRYIGGKVFPLIGGFFRHFGFTTTRDNEYGYVHGGIID